MINAKSCSYCNKKIRTDKSKRYRNKHFFCSKECFGKWTSVNKIGENASNFKNALLYKKCECCNQDFTTYFSTQRFCSVDCKNRSQIKQVELVCNSCNGKFKRTSSQIFWANRRGYENIFCSQKCTREYLSGKNHPNYIFDRSLLKDQNKTIRSSKEMCEWRKSVYKRDDYTCQICKAHSSKNNAVILNAHHIIRFIDNEKLRFDINNGITLCEGCHKLTYGKEKEFEERFNRIVENKS
ncbi:HNH endonuclease [Niallia endozanthoxylica]|uniref:HNH endonuclease n=1 Tax=Niallia endozanthoxylica TaxID=2036016 RepID=UPI001CC6C195|nr:HNH endonuclease [Niallia endozanthoxylica]